MWLMLQSDKYTNIRKTNVRILLRERFGDRQASLAEELGVSQQAVSSWVSESEKSRPMGERAARKMEEKLHLQRYSLDSQTFAQDNGFSAQQISAPPSTPTTVLIPGDVVQLKKQLDCCLHRFRIPGFYGGGFGRAHACRNPIHRRAD